MMRIKKYTIEQIFDWFASNEDLLKMQYDKHIVKDKKIPKNAFPFERFCLIMFDREMNEYDNLIKKTKKNI